MAENTRSTATIENSESKVEKLNGKTNYLGWSKVMMSELKKLLVKQNWVQQNF